MPCRVLLTRMRCGLGGKAVGAKGREVRGEGGGGGLRWKKSMAGHLVAEGVRGSSDELLHALDMEIYITVDLPRHESEINVTAAE